MKRFLVAATYLFATSMFGMATARGETAPLIPVEVFAQLPDYTGIELSPQGTDIAMLRPARGKYVLITQPLFDPDVKHMKLIAIAGTDLRWFHWKTNNRLVLGVSFVAETRGVPTTETRMVAIGKDQSHPINLYDLASGPSFQPSDNDLSQVQDRVLDWLPDDPDHILVEIDRSKWAFPDVDRVDINNGSHSLVLAARDGVMNWTTDQTGEVRFGLGSLDHNRLILTRAPGKGWQTSSEKVDPKSDDEFTPVGFSSDPNILYVISNRQTGYGALYEYNLSARSFGKKLFGEVGQDVIGATISQQTHELRSVSYTGDTSGVHNFDQSWARLKAAINHALPGTANRIVSTSKDENLMIIEATSDTNPGDFYFFDHAKHHMTYLFSSYQTLPVKQMSHVKRISYKARDGQEIEGYLTIPNGAEAKNLPLIVLPHGGPAAEDGNDFDYWVQFLASRGYAVLQMNYRGSTGYGAKFQSAGYQQWGLVMQDDITDGTKWAIAQGIADPRRICIVGGSYGGYAALMGAVKTPNLYRCAASFAGVSDLPKMAFHAQYYLYGKSVEEELGKSSAQRRDMSPIKHVADIKIPILLMHGDHDRVVPYQQSEEMAEALKDAGKKYEYVVIPGGDHHLSDGNERLIFLKKLGAFLAANLN